MLEDLTMAVQILPVVVVLMGLLTLLAALDTLTGRDDYALLVYKLVAKTLQENNIHVPSRWEVAGIYLKSTLKKAVLEALSGPGRKRSLPREGQINMKLCKLASKVRLAQSSKSPPIAEGNADVPNQRAEINSRMLRVLGDAVRRI